MAGNYRYRISSREVDSSSKARICAVGELLLEAAGDDADTLGFGIGDLNLEGASWVLSRMAVEIDRRPARGECVDIYTWVSDYGRVLTTRNMIVTDADANPIGAAVTQWAMIDVATRRPLDLSALSNKSAALVDRPPPIDRPRKAGGVVGDCSERLHTVKYSDIDFNGHVNSMKYLEWILDSLFAASDEAANGGGRCRIDINYLHEARSGDTLVIRHAAEGDSHNFEIKNADDTAICKATITT